MLSKAIAKLQLVEWGSQNLSDKPDGQVCCICRFDRKTKKVFFNALFEMHLCRCLQKW